MFEVDAATMEEIFRFLHDHSFFRSLPDAELSRVAARVRVERFAPNADILIHGGAPSPGLYVIRAGNVDLLREDERGVQVFDTLGVGEVFGQVSLIRNQPPIVTVRAREATQVYLVPAATFNQLRRDYPDFARFFATSAVERLQTPLRLQQSAASPMLFQTRLGDLVHRDPVMVRPNASVREAALVMRDQNVSCLVVDTQPPGILTDSDLRNQVLAVGLSDATPVAQVMCAPAQTLPADNLVFEGLMLMLERGFNHLPVTNGQGRVIGVITHTDILRQESRSPLFLPSQLQRARTIDDLRAYTRQVAQTVGALLDASARVSDIGRVVAVAHDALLVRLLTDAEASLGPPPCPYAWLVLGSEGRYEQTLRTDQDNALVYAESALPEAEAYFAALADRVVGQLVECGFPRCPGEIMATNPKWRQPLQTWQGYFQRWISMPEEEALLRVAIFFDYHQVHGTLEVEPGLRPIIERGKENRVFLGRLARAALRQSAPLNFFRQIVLERQGDQRDLLDLKHRGTALIVDLARLFALEAGVAATNTLTRLHMAVGRSSLSERGSQELAAAYELITLFRLRQQYQQIQQSEAPTNLLALSRLTDLERRELKEALLAIGRTQRSVAFTFQTERIA